MAGATEGVNTGITRRGFLRLLGLTMLATVGACATLGGEADYTIEIVEQHSFSPASLTVPLGARVAWKNLGKTPHTVTADPVLAKRSANALLPQGAQPFDSGALYPGEVWAHTFTTPGEYVYFCRYHEDENMVGAISVME